MQQIATKVKVKETSTGILISFENKFTEFLTTGVL
jgi:hypothetical protein